jgi:mono/diheme cytochrome c family protein
MLWVLACAAQGYAQPAGSSLFSEFEPMLENHCVECHEGEKAKGGMDLTKLPRDLQDRSLRDRWIRIHDRMEKGDMPPKKADLPEAERAEMLRVLGGAILKVDREEVVASGRGALRRLNREEYQNNLRDLLQMPQLDIRDILPEDREGHHFNKTTETLDMSRVQLTAHLDAAEVALRAAMVTQKEPPKVGAYRAVGTRLFPSLETFGNREAMFFARDGAAVKVDRKMSKEEAAKWEGDEGLELALFRSASWPYFGYPKGCVAKVAGEYRVRFSARAVLQSAGYKISEAKQPQAMTFRARKPSGADVSGDVRATGGILDIAPECGVYETTVLLRAGETFEYSLLGLPVPLTFNINGGTPTYRFPPFAEGGQPGVAFQWLEVEGPIAAACWPPQSHRVLFDELPVGVAPEDAKEEARRLLRRFVGLAVREPLPEGELQMFERLVFGRLDKGDPFSEALLAGYKAVLCSVHFLYLREPERPGDHFAVASRLSHFLTNTRPDETLSGLAEAGALRRKEVLRSESQRLIAGESFDRFIRNFTAYWLNLRHVRRDDPDIRLYPEYRFDDYLVESMERETRAFVSAMIRENLPSKVLVDADFVYANDRLAKHYQLPPVAGSEVRKVPVPEGSPYGGLLTQASVLKVTANGTTTSPVVRGAWVMERLIGQPAPPAPPSVPAVEPDIRGAKTIRDVLAQHTKNASCAACHAKFDPVGLALEGFDILGGWRTQYRGLEEGEKVHGIDRAGHDFAYTLSAPVDASGKLLDGPAFGNIQDLKAILASHPRQLGRNLLEQFTIYATGTPVRFSDRSQIESILDACAADGFRVGDLLLGLIQSRIFLGNPGCE